MIWGITAFLYPIVFIYNFGIEFRFRFGFGEIPFRSFTTKNLLKNSTLCFYSLHALFTAPLICSRPVLHLNLFWAAAFFYVYFHFQIGYVVQRVCTMQLLAIDLEHWIASCNFFVSVHFYLFSYKKWSLAILKTRYKICDFKNVRPKQSQILQLEIHNSIALLPLQYKIPQSLQSHIFFRF